MDPLRCILPSGLYLVLHQFSALHSYTPQSCSPTGSQRRVGSCWAVRSTQTQPSLLAQPEAQPRLLQSPAVSELTALGLGRSRSHQLCLSWCCCSGDQRSWVRAAEGSACLRASLFHSSLSGNQSWAMSELFHVLCCSSLFQRTVKVITAHLFCCLLIKSYLITTFWSQ